MKKVHVTYFVILLLASGSFALGAISQPHLETAARWLVSEEAAILLLPPGGWLLKLLIELIVQKLRGDGPPKGRSSKGGRQ